MPTTHLSKKRPDTEAQIATLMDGAGSPLISLRQRLLILKRLLESELSSGHKGDDEALAVAAFVDDIYRDALGVIAALDDVCRDAGWLVESGGAR